MREFCVWRVREQRLIECMLCVLIECKKEDTLLYML